MNHYEALKILGLGSGATLEDARHAYREQVKLWHPDRYSDNSALKSLALKNVQDANRAWAYLRPRLPVQPKSSVANARKRGRNADSPRAEVNAQPKINLGEWLLQGVRKITPLVAHVRKLRFGGIAGWLREDPQRHYRPWYRYAQKSAEAPPNERPATFGQTLTQVLKKKNTGCLPETTGDRPRRNTRLTTPLRPVSKTGNRGGDGVGAIDPIKRGSRSG